MIVCHAHRFVFLKTRKTAGTSIELALARVCGPDDTITPLNPDDEAQRAADGIRGPQHFEAPPLQRKAYNHMPARLARRAVGRQVWEDYFTFAVERNPWDAVVSAYFWTHRDRADPPAFDTWVQGPQVEKLAKNAQVYRIRGEIVVDRVCRYEDLDEEMARIWQELELPEAPALPRAKGHARPARSPYREMYTTASRRRVAEAFAETIETLGYDF